MKRDVHLWDLRTEPPTGPIRVEHAITGPLGNPTAVMSLALSPDGRFLLTGANGAIQIWNLTTNTRVALCEHAGNIRGIAVHPEGKFFVSASEGKSHCVWNLEGKLLAGPIIHDAFVYRARFHPSGRWFVTATIHGDVQAWSSDTLRPVGSEIHHAGGINSLDFSPDGKSLLVAMNSGLAYVWSMNFEATNLLWQMPAPTGLTQVQLHAEKDLFAVSANDGTIRLGDANTGRWLPRVYSHGRDAKLIFSMFRHSPRIAIRVIVNPLLEKSDLAIFWNYETGETFESKPFPCDSLGFSLSPDDRHLVVWSGDRLWIEEIAAGKRDGPISLPGGVAGDSIAFLNKRTMLIALATGRVVELGIGENIVKDAALPHPGGVNNVSLSRSRQWLATHCADQHVRRWDLPSRRLLPPVIANIEGPIEFDRRDRLLVTSGDGLRIFDPFTGRLLGPMLHDDHPPLRWFSVSKTQDAVLAISDHSIRMWRLPIMASAPLPELRDGIERSTGLSLTPEGEVRKIDEKAWSERINRKAMR